MRRILLAIALAALLPAAATHAASPYGDCEVLFVDGKAPKAPHAVTPLCEARTDAVFFATGYSKTENHGSWSAYRLDQEQAIDVEEHPLPRPNVTFHQNPKLNGGSYVQPRNDSYTGTGFDRGHLAPNGAMAWDEEAQKASFTVSNIAPQDPAMNRNIWRCFEASIREWAETSGTTYVVVGTTRGTQKISSNKDPRHVKIDVPTHYIAMVYREKPSPMAIGVMVPNTAGNLDVRDFIMSVTALEQETGFDYRLPESVAGTNPDLTQWPTRILSHEFMDVHDVPIDTQCPRVQSPDLVQESGGGPV
jgi:DNA/RNA endonuclease G (NUC1)